MEFKETSVINELQAHLITQTTERAMFARYGREEMQHRTDMCEFSAEVARHQALALGFDANMYNVANINIARGVRPDETFTHQVTIAKKGKNTFLFEPSFIQFVDKSKGILIYRPWIETNHSINHPLVQKMIKRRFVKLNDMVFNDYLDLTSIGNQKRVGLDLLDKVIPEIPMMTLQDAQMFGVKQKIII